MAQEMASSKIENERERLALTFLVQQIPIKDIIIPEGRKPVGNVDELRDSIERYGVLHPIVVRKVNDKFYIVAGLTRLLAVQLLGRESIPATVLLPIEDIDAKIIEIDENVVRAHLDDPQMDELLLKRKELYEQKFPEAKRGGDRKSVGSDEKQKSFAEDSAKKTGKSKRVIEKAITRAKKNTPKVKEAREQKKITQSQADALTSLTAEKQDAIVDQVEGKSVIETKNIVSAILGKEPVKVPVPDNNAERHSSDCSSHTFHLDQIKELGKHATAWLATKPAVAEVHDAAFEFVFCAKELLRANPTAITLDREFKELLSEVVDAAKKGT